MASAWYDTPAYYYARKLEKFMCRLGIHTVYCKYDMTTVRWEHLGLHCQFCDCKCKEGTGGYYRRKAK